MAKLAIIFLPCLFFLSKLDLSVSAPVPSNVKDDTSGINSDSDESEILGSTNIKQRGVPRFDLSIDGPTGVACRFFASLLELPAWDRTTATLATTTNGTQLQLINSTFFGHIISGKYIISPQNRSPNADLVPPHILLVSEGSASVERFEATAEGAVPVYTLGPVEGGMQFNSIFITGFTESEIGIDEIIPNPQTGVSKIVRIENQEAKYLQFDDQFVGFKQVDNIRFNDQNGEDKKYTIFVEPYPLSTILVQLGEDAGVKIPSQSDPAVATASTQLTQAYLDSKFYIAGIGRTSANNGIYIYRTETPATTPFTFSPVKLIYSDLSSASHIPNLIYTPPNSDLIYGCKGNVFFRIDNAYSTNVPRPLNAEFSFPADTQCRKIVSFQNCPSQVYVLLNNMRGGKEESLSSIAYSQDAGQSFTIIADEDPHLAHIDIAAAEIYV